MAKCPKWFKGCPTELIIAYSRLRSLNPFAWTLLHLGLEQATDLIEVSESALLGLGLSPLQILEIRSLNRSVAREQQLMLRLGIELITIEDGRYPAMLKEISDPPLWLYCQGEIEVCEQQPCLTVVGARQPSAAISKIISKLLPPKLCQSIVIVSGLAYGVDRFAHQAALSANGRTVAVLAGGLDRIYPSEHSQLADQIIETGGLLLSEYPPLWRPEPANFLVRNRIVAGLSPATVVVEGTFKSGTLTTARLANDYNRDVFAVPGAVTSELSQAPNLLIKQGATLLDDPEQLSEYYVRFNQLPLLPNVDRDS